MLPGQRSAHGPAPCHCASALNQGGTLPFPGPFPGPFLGPIKGGGVGGTTPTSGGVGGVISTLPPRMGGSGIGNWPEVKGLVILGI